MHCAYTSRRCLTLRGASQPVPLSDIDFKCKTALVGPHCHCHERNARVFGGQEGGGAFRDKALRPSESAYFTPRLSTFRSCRWECLPRWCCRMRVFCVAVSLRCTLCVAIFLWCMLMHCGHSVRTQVFGNEQRGLSSAFSSA